MLRRKQYRGIAQLVEQRSPKPRAEGSNPSAPAIRKALKLRGFKAFLFFINSARIQICAVYSVKIFINASQMQVNFANSLSALKHSVCYIIKIASKKYFY